MIQVLLHCCTCTIVFNKQETFVDIQQVYTFNTHNRQENSLNILATSRFYCFCEHGDSEK